jgi:hypothetical protein
VNCAQNELPQTSVFRGEEIQNEYVTSGLIPSKKRVEAGERRSRLRVRFDDSDELDKKVIVYCNIEIILMLQSKSPIHSLIQHVYRASSPRRKNIEMKKRSSSCNDIRLSLPIATYECVKLIESKHVQRMRDHVI